jgi:uncharacterized protein YndB with AHSA1/START domain
MAVTTDSGTVERDGDSYALRFDREYRAPIAEVWSAITTPERAARWIGELHGTLSTGERIVLVMGDTDDEQAAVDIHECREPHRLAVGWQFPGAPLTRVTVDLSEVDAARTRVVLLHTGWKRHELAGYGCGWHHYVDCLDAHLAGRTLPAFEDYFPALLDGWRARVAAA